MPNNKEDTMKNKVFKVSVVLVMILTMTMTNFIFVGSSLISYALDDHSNTNINNVEFNTYFKNDKGEKVSNMDMTSNFENILYLYLNIKQEGYFNGSIRLENGSNFKLLASDNQYVKSVENDTVNLYQMTAGTSIEIPIKIEPIKEDSYPVSLLDVETKVTIHGIYKDSSQKDKEVKATKIIKLKLIDEVSQEDIINEATMITNKILNIEGQEKRVVQLSWKVGLKNNNYPIKEISANIKTPMIEDKEPQVEIQADLNNMTSYDHQNENGVHKIVLKNEATQEGTINWKKAGTENMILTYIYDKDVKIHDITLDPEVKVILYNQKEMSHTSQIIFKEEEKDATVQITTTNQEQEVYKGKLVAGIDRQYETKTSVKVNLAKMVQDITIKENENTYTVNETENSANIFYTQTLMAKDQFDHLLGENGEITIVNQFDQVIATIDASTQANESGYIVINYGESQTKAITIKVTGVTRQGNLEITHVKTIKETQKEMVKTASRIHQIISCEYNQGNIDQVENNVNLIDTVTESKIGIDMEQLSTVVNNHVEMKIALLSNEEKYDLYENPNFTITLPNQVENVNITNISKLYDNDDEFGEVQYATNGNQINLILNGKQTHYTSAVEGLTIVVEADIQVNKTAATSEEQIVMSYQNGNAVAYANDAVASTPIKITAPKEITAVNRIRELAVETIGEEETKQIMMEKATAAKQVVTDMEIINSNVSAIKDVRIVGDFPTDDNQNNMGITIQQGIQVAGVEQAKVYYSAKEEVTDDITDEQNGWSENLDGKEAKKYLILLDTVEAQSSVQANYQMTIPENLAYNEEATQGYSIYATNSETGTGIQLDATKIAMQTGVGPQVESELQASVGVDNIGNGTVVKNGEVITYKIKVSNTGTEEATNVNVVGKIPEGTVLVEPMPYYPYTGAAYYQENKEAENYAETIEELAVGQSEIVEYEVRVNTDVEAGTNITNEIEVQYGEAKKTNNITHKVENATIRTSVKRVTDPSFEIYGGDSVGYYAIIENMSNAEQKNVTVQTNLSDNTEVKEFTLMKNVGVYDITQDTIRDPDGEYDNISDDNLEEDEEDEVVEEEGEITLENQTQLEYQKEVNIGDLNPGEAKVLYYVIKAKDAGENAQADRIQLSVTGKSDHQTCRSNVWEDTILHYNIKANMTTGTESQFVKAGDEIEYKITIQNTGTGKTRLVKMLDYIPNDLDIKSITIDGQEQEITEESNEVKVSTYIEPQSTVNIEVKATVAYHENTEAKTIKNTATIERNGEVVANTPEITHIIKENASNSGEIENPDPNNPNNPDDDNHNNTQTNQPNVTQGNNIIAGVAWLDSDSDGVKEETESLLSNITVKLLNVETNEIVKNTEGNEIITTTNAEGIYLLQNIPNGKYIVVFDYDRTRYGLTTYQASGIPESNNSNAVINTLNINGTTTEVPSTDIITVENNDISNINIGLIELKNFDLQLEKSIRRILVQDASGSTVREYDNVDMAKIELDAKKVNGSTVLIEYNIKVSNVGQVDGYVKKVVDYLPGDLKFSSELNKDWYQTNGLLYNASLANDKIPAGTNKTITLTLTKAMTGNNTGLTTNTAEIAEDYNELGLKDSNSTPGNKATGENDMSSADVIISIRTGGILYVSIIIIMIVTGSVVTFVILKRKNKTNDEEMI